MNEGGMSEADRDRENKRKLGARLKGPVNNKVSILTKDMIVLKPRLLLFGLLGCGLLLGLSGLILLGDWGQRGALLLDDQETLLRSDSFGHSSHIHDSIDACVRWRLQNLSESNAAKLLSSSVANDTKGAYLFLPKEAQIPSKDTLICGYILILVKKNHSQSGEEFKGIEGFPRDSVLVNAAGSHASTVGRVGRVPLLSFDLQDGSMIRVYPFALELRDSGFYSVTGTLECNAHFHRLLSLPPFTPPHKIDVNNEWNYETPSQITWDPVPLKYLIRHESGMIELQNSLSIHVHDGLVLSKKLYSKLPFCENGDHPGRWVNATLVLGNQDLPASKANPEHFQDEDGRLWLPYACRYRLLGYSNFGNCLAAKHPVLHVWGDSNMRRSLKALSTGGTWCQTMYDSQSPECNCYDWHLSVPFMNASRALNVIPITAVNKNTSIVFYSWQGLLPWGPNWRWDMLMDQFEKQVASISSDFTVDLMHPSALILSMTNWDAAYGTYDMAKKAIYELAERIKASYPGVPIIWRPGQFYCCPEGADLYSNGDEKRRLSRLRVEAINELFSSVLKKEFGARVWDIYTMGESQAPSIQSHIAKCVSNHMSRVGVALENQVLMNMLCPPQ